MANHRSPVPKWLNKSYMQEILISYFDEQDLCVQEIDISPGSKEGDNYLGQIFRINLLLVRNGEQKSLSIIGKQTPQTGFAQMFGDASDVFVVEAGFFSSLLPLLKKANEGVAAAREFAPDPYYVDYKNRLILMNDLMVDGYRMLPHTISLPMGHAIVIVETLAALHGASHRVLLEQPELKKKYLTTTLWHSHVIDKWFDNMYRALEKNVDKLGLPADWSRKLLSKKNVWSFRSVLEVDDSKLNFILHGDPWMNNILFHFKDDVVDKIKFLDYQTVGYGSFTNDILYSLFTSVEANVLVNNLDLIIGKYLDVLIAVAPEIPNLTFERIKNEIYDALVFGFMMAVMFRPMFRNDHPPDMEKVVKGQLYDRGFSNDTFLADIKIFLPFFDKLGLL